MKNVFYSLICASLLFIISCNNVKDKEKKEDSNNAKISVSIMSNILNCKEAGGLGNFIIDPKVAEDMIDTFKKNYDKFNGKDDIKALVNEYWMDSCTIFSIANFLRTQKKFDGVRFHFTANTIDDNSYNQGIYKNKTSLSILPTISPKINKYGHQDQYDLITYENCNNATNYIKSVVIINSQKSIFNKVFRNNIKKDTSSLLSEGVWIDSCLIFAMETIIKDVNTNFDGINIHLAAYLGNEIKKPSGMEKSKQSTIIFALTDGLDKNGEHISNFSFLYNLLIDYIKRENKILSDYRFNHGELCPKICDTLPQN